MGRVKQGYTILETMIVIGVSAVMFITAVAAFSGSQQDVQFSQSIRDLESKIQDVINDVSVGFFNNDGSIACSEASAAGDRLDLVYDASLSAQQGSNNECIFVGKAIQFAPNGDPNSIQIYTIFCRRNAASGGVTQSLNDAEPEVIADVSNPDLNRYIEQYDLEWGTEISHVGINDGGSVENYGAVAFVTAFARSIGNVDISNSSVRNGAVKGTTLTDTQTQFITTINNLNEDTTSLAAGSIDLRGNEEINVCLRSPSGDRASIVIGGSGSTTTRLAIDNFDPDVCRST